MPKRYAKGSRAWGECRRSGKRLLLNDMVRDGQFPNLIVAPDWYEPRHPQENLPIVGDPVALYRPAPESDSAAEDTEFRFPAVDPITYQVIPDPVMGNFMNPLSYTVDPGIVVYVGSLCSYESEGTSPLVMSIPPGTMVGDFMLLTVGASATTGVTITPPPGWNMLTNVTTAGFSPDDETDEYFLHSVFAYRFMQSGDTTVSIVSTETASNFNAGGCIHSFRNVDQDRPIPQMLSEVTTDSTALGGTYFMSLPPMNNVAIGSKVVGFLAGPSSGAPVFGVNPPVCIHPTEFLESADMPTPSPQPIGSLIFTPAQTEFQNLLPYGFRNFNSWSKTNMVVDDADLTNPVRTDLDPTNGTSGRHEIYQMVTLAAGTTYTFGLSSSASTGTTVDNIYIAVDDSGIGGGVGEIGESYDKNSQGLSLSGTFSGGGFQRRYIKRVGTAGSATTLNGGVFVVFTPVVSGSHKISIGFSHTPGDPESVYVSNQDGGKIWHATLSAGENLLPFWRDIGSEGAPLPSVGGVFGRIINGFDPPNNQMKAFAFEIRAVSRAPDLVRLTMGHTNFCEFKVGRIGIADSGPGANNVGAVSTGFVDPWQNAAGGKFYYEVTCGPTIWDSDTNSGTALGFSTAWVRGSFQGDIGSLVADSNGCFTYLNRGTIQNETTTIGSAAPTYTNGNTIGVGIDFAAGEIYFYKIGTGLVYTITVPATYLLAPFRAFVLAHSTASIGRELTCNFTGPFLALPSGFVAYDWENTP